MHISNISDPIIRDAVREVALGKDIAWEISFSGVPRPDGQGGLGFQPIMFLVMVMPSSIIGAPHIMRFAPCDPMIATHKESLASVVTDTVRQLIEEYEGQRAVGPISAPQVPSGLIIPGR